MWDFSALLRNPLWQNEKDNALVKWSLHLHKKIMPMKSLLHQPKNNLKNLNPLIKLLIFPIRDASPSFLSVMLAMIKTLLNHLLLQMMKPRLVMIKVNLPVKTGTQMIKMIK